MATSETLPKRKSSTILSGVVCGAKVLSRTSRIVRCPAIIPEALSEFLRKMRRLNIRARPRALPVTPDVHRLRPSTACAWLFCARQHSRKHFMSVLDILCFRVFEESKFSNFERKFSVSPNIMNLKHQFCKNEIINNSREQSIN